MTERNQRRVFPIQPSMDNQAPLPDFEPTPGQWLAPTGILRDTLHRPLRDLRISVTDRCNFRCSYCMPKEVFDNKHTYLPHAQLLSFEEITRIARECVSHGVEKIRLTGGEPLLRKGIEALIEQLAALRTPEGKALDITLTTNGSLLARKAQSLKDAGLKRITVSLDGLDDTIFRAMNDVDFPVADVLDGIAVAKAVGLGPIKVNMVVKRGTNDAEIAPMAQHFKGSGITLRFIEYMDVGSSNGWRMDDVVPSAEVVERIRAEHALIALEAAKPGETAQRWGYANAQGVHDVEAGEFGVISSVTQAFCGDCNRVRLSTEGKLYLCLFASQGHDLRQLMRSTCTDQALSTAIARIWHARTDRYSALRGSQQSPLVDASERKIEMSYIGG